MPVPVTALALVLAGCGGSAPPQLSVSHRHAPNGETRIVVMPVELAEGIAATPDAGETLGSLYATELLRSYDILDFRRFQKHLASKKLDIGTILENGQGAAIAQEMGIDGVLLSRVYEWKPGAPGFWFLSKSGRVGFMARLVDLRSGSVIWSANHVRQTDPADPLSVGLSQVFRELAMEMPRHLTGF